MNPLRWCALFATLTWAAGLAHAAPAPKLPPAVQSQLQHLLQDPGLSQGQVGIAVVALGKAKTPAEFPAAPYDGGAQPLLFASNESKRFLPASNMKLFTAAWTLKTLGAERTFTTKVWISPIKVWNEVWPSQSPQPLILTLAGDGDPSLTTEGLQSLAKQIITKKPGVPFIVTVAHDGFHAEENGGRYPDGWTLDDAIWYYGAPVGALAINRNEVDITITGTKPGDLAEVKTEPEAPFPLFAPVKTVPVGDPAAGHVHYDFGNEEGPLSGTLVVEGSVAPGQVVTDGIAVPDPPAWAKTLLQQALKDNGAQLVEPQGAFGAGDPIALNGLVSPPVKTLLIKFLKTSDNLYGEMLLRRTAQTLPPDPAEDASRDLPGGVTISSTKLAGRAHADMATWLKTAGVPTQGLRFSDGSGLSRYDMLTPVAVARLLGAVQKIKDGDALYNALPIAGVDGTLKKRMLGTAAVGNVRAKTGTFSIANCLSGYVTTKDGNRLAVSILTNFVPDGELARNWEGKVFATLAAANLTP
jgi:D-alanyl-D-alanine carboxypeptidase/D-alanyl-D-alanine-endopeptidase (penicillin-binding protein 4)